MDMDGNMGAGSIRENYEFYILDGTKLVSEYSATCWDCGFHFEVTNTNEIPGLL